MPILTVSHLVLTSQDVGRISQFIQMIFLLKPHFENPEFTEFVFPTGFRLAFFKPVGASTKSFSVTGSRECASIGITVKGVDNFYNDYCSYCLKSGIPTPLPPKDHPWGEKSFLLIDPDGNRWEVTESPTPHGMLTTRN